MFPEEFAWRTTDMHIVNKQTNEAFDFSSKIFEDKSTDETSQREQDTNESFILVMELM